LSVAQPEGTSSNRYTILGRLAGGGMADIFLARVTTEAGVERHVVLKRVLAERSRDPQFARMFLDEARLAAQLQHPNIAQVHDIGKLAGSYFFTMEYVHGEDARHILQRLSGLKKRLPINLALHIASGALAALQHAHNRLGADGKPLGVVHRDVSPSNVMVSFEGIVKLLDFGVAKAAQRSVESQTGSIKGKIAYLSPEQCKGAGVDRRSDLYALGIVLHELLTGRRLYKRENDFASMMAIATEAAPRPSLSRPEISAELDAIVMRALEKDPDQRYASATEMLEAIENLVMAERHLVSSTAMARYLRELFGEKPEPWVELQERDDGTRQVTITSESLGGDPLQGVAAIGNVPAKLPTLDPDAQLVAQLDRARPLWSASDDESDDAIEEADAEATALTAQIPTPPVPSLTSELRAQPPPTTKNITAPTPRPSRPSIPPAPAPAAPTTSELIAPLPPPPSVQMAVPNATLPGPPPKMTLVTRSATIPPPPGPMSGGFAAPSVTSSGFAPAYAPPPSPRRRWVVFAVAGGIVAIVIGIVLATSGGSPAPATQQPMHVAVTVEDAAREPAPVVDAAEVVAAPPAEPTLADALAGTDDALSAKLCARAKSLTADERTGCGVAACNARQLRAAIGYYQEAGKGKALIERACRDHGLSVLAPATPPTHPKRDPCEENPLKCQK
jgi:serine/threonine-protein kinase